LFSQDLPQDEVICFVVGSCLLQLSGYSICSGSDLSLSGFSRGKWFARHTWLAGYTPISWLIERKAGQTRWYLPKPCRQRD